MELTSVVLQVMAGLGLFLLGMSLMTDGLKALAGDSIRRWLMQFTRSPLSGIGTGIAATALLQSSTATIIATVGFVGAGLLTFSQSLGIIFGATVGTTLTGWIIALVGFKLKLGSMAAVLIFLGALMRLFGGRRTTGLAFSLAGFGLIFIGIESLQQGLEGLQDHIDFSCFSADGLSGKVKLAAVGILITLLTQSSTVGVAAVLTSMHTGAIGLEQGAALVVGMNVGTTFTAAVATIGGNVHVRRTGLSHVVYSSLVSVMALFLIQPYIAVWDWLAPNGSHHQSEVALVMFHTGFTLLGVMLVYPVIPRFARLIERLFPEPPSTYHKLLDRQLLPFPELALTNVQQALLLLENQLVQRLNYLLGAMPRATSLADMEESLRELEAYLDAIHLPSTSGVQWDRLMAALHSVDHLERLRERAQDESVLITLRSGDVLEHLVSLVLQLVQAVGTNQPRDMWQETVAALAVEEQSLRQTCLQQIALGRLELRQGVALMDAARWLQHVAVHLDRIDQSNRQLNYQQP